ncbi:dihydrodipicolinate reductase C-terminal domain-containing protein [Nonomuraea sp. NPDC003201]
MINVCFAGVTGWTASPIVAAIDRADDLTLTAGVSRSAAGKSLAERPAPRAVRTPEPAVPLGELHGPVEARGAEVAGSRIHSVRLPSFVVSTEIVFGGPGERLVMRHDPGTDPSPYVAGTLPAVRHAGEETGVRRGLDSLLFRG